VVDYRELHRRIGLAALDRHIITTDRFARAMLAAGAEPAASPNDIWVTPGLIDRVELAEVLHAVDPGGVYARSPGSRSPSELRNALADAVPATAVAALDEDNPGRSLNLGDMSRTMAIRDGEVAAPDAVTDPLPARRPGQPARGESPESDASPRYMLGAELGRGGVGRVIKAFDRYLGRTVAMKLPLQSPLPPDEAERFIEEAQATGQLEHPNIVPIYDIGVLATGEAFYTMKRVRNQSLRNVIDGLKQNVPQIVREYGPTRLLSIFLQVCQAVHYAHVRGVIHRDLKPDNIMLGDFGEVHVMDWGLARIVNRGVVTDRSLHGGDRSEFGHAVGTPAYMAPEQARGDTNSVNEKSDVYALGVILYEIVTLKQPSTRPTVMETLMAIVSEPIVPPSKAAPDRAIVPDMERIIMRALEKDADKRFATAREIHDAVENFIDGRSAREAERHLLEGESLARLYESAKKEMLAADQAVDEAAVDIQDWEPVEVKRHLWTLEDRRREASTRMARAFGEAIRELTQALAYVPDKPEARRALARLYFSRYELAEREDNERDTLYYESLLKQYDDGTFLDGLHEEAPVSIYTRPRKAAVFVQRLDERDRTQVPGPPEHLGESPIIERFTPRGSYVVRIKHPSYPLVHMPLHINRPDPIGVHVELPDPAWFQPGFCYIPAGQSVFGGDAEAFDPLTWERLEVGAHFMQRRPVTFREYLEFLDDIALQDPALAHQHVPRTRETEGALAIRSRNGRFVPVDVLIEGAMRTIYPYGAGHEWDLPVLCITHHDAQAYAAWRAARDKVPYRLPTEFEWERAGRGADARIFPWGDHFDATFCKMASSRPMPSQPEPVGAFAYDRSPFDVRDLAGGVREWVDSDDADEAQAIQRGGSWRGDARACRLASRWRSLRTARFIYVGFRLAYSPVGEPPPSAEPT
jgi:serine/threonine-protein kinase